MFRTLLSILTVSALVTIGVAQSRMQTRCGWLSNPTPANAWLIDKNGEWLIGVQGGYQAEGDLLDFSPGRWVKTNGDYGYGCACIYGKFDVSQKKVVEIFKSTAKSLSQCRRDRLLNNQEPR